MVERASPPAVRVRTVQLPLLSAGAFAAFLLLGRAVSQRPPGAFDLLAASESGHLTGLALALRLVGLFPPYCALCVAALVAGIVWRAWLPAALAGIVQLLVVWRVSDYFKAAFHRPRPVWWFHIEENSFSYASGHAALALAFYGFVAYAVWTSAAPLAVKRCVAAGCWTLVLAIGWSRLALGAHYPSDIVGGYLLGITTLFVTVPAYGALRVALRHGADSRVRQTS